MIIEKHQSSKSLKISAQFEQEQFRKTLNSGTLNILIGIVDTRFENAEDLNRLLINWRQGFRKGCHAKQTSKIKYNFDSFFLNGRTPQQA